MNFYFSKAIILVLSISLSCMGCQQAHSTQQVQDTLPGNELQQADSMRVDLSTDTFSIPLDLEYIMGRFDPTKHPDFVVIDSQHADKAGMYLRKDTYEAFKKMYTHALKDSIRLQIRSATRNFYAQKNIWEGKWTGTRLIENGENLSETTPDPKERALKILRYSSMPGSSRHHWGTDIDLNNFENSWFEKGEGLDIYNWLTANAATYGFCQPYTPGRPHGYFEERWHWTFMPVSVPLTNYARTHFKNNLIDGFLGSETAPMIDIVNKYVLGINEECVGKELGTRN